MDALRLGSALRSVRIRMDLTQAAVARRAGVSRATVSRIEHGQIHRFKVETLATVAAALEVRIDLIPRWRGGDLPLLLNAGHAALHEAMAQRLRSIPDWRFAPEVSFSIYGERGVVDILAFHPGGRALLVIELKTELVDIHGLMSSVDRYRRLAGRIARERAWAANSVSCWVILRDTDTNRRRVAAHRTVLRAAFPDDGIVIRRWLRNPVGVVAGLSFLSDVHTRNASGRPGGVRRVRRRRMSVT